MHLIRGLVAAVLACAVSVGASFAADTPVSDKIIGGTVATAGKWPFVVALVKSKVTDNYQAQFCGGTLIASRFVLTAAHCIYDETNGSIAASSVKVLVGTQDLKSGGLRFTVSKIYRHPYYDAAATDYDVAVLKLSQAVPSALAKPATIIKPSQAATLAKVGTKAYVTGWGNMVDGGNSFPRKLMQVQVPVLSNSKCSVPYDDLYGPDTFTSRMLCAGTTNGSKDSCQGDSGGPLFVPTTVGGSTYKVVAGVVSWGEGCAHIGYPGIYTRVAHSSINTWILQQLAR